MNKKYIPITSIDQLKQGDIIQNILDDNTRRVVSGICGGIVFLTHISGEYNGIMSLVDLNDRLYQLEVEEVKWRPTEGEYYFYPDPSDCVAKYGNTTFSKSYSIDIKRVEIGQAFQTREEAINACQKMLDVLKDNQ